ncbi:MAG: hypothetical protein ACTFAK_09210 [Candidatus Electronema sp. VV]
MKRNTLPVLMGILLWSQAAAASGWHVRLTVTAPDDPPPVRAWTAAMSSGSCTTALTGWTAMIWANCRLLPDQWGTQIPQHRLSASRMERKL